MSIGLQLIPWTYIHTKVSDWLKDDIQLLMYEGRTESHEQQFFVK